MQIEVKTANLPVMCKCAAFMPASFPLGAGTGTSRPFRQYPQFPVTGLEPRRMSVSGGQSA